MIKTVLRRIPGMGRFIQSGLWTSYRHSVALRNEPRVNSHFTGFLRLPTQFEALAGPVVEFLLDGDPKKPLRIASIGCSNGAEAYTVASYLTNRRPTLEYSVQGLDIEPEVIAKAGAGIFDGENEVYCNQEMTTEFVDATFEVEGDRHIVKPEIKRHVSFAVADILDEQAVERYSGMDIVYAQNFLFHLEPSMATRAFGNICRMLNSRAALFVDGTDLPLRQKLTRKYGLAPLDYEIEQIHNEARWARSVGWPYRYWGLEPFMFSRRDWRRRYATIFVRKEA